MRTVGLVLLAFALPAAAQDLPFSAEPTEACLATIPEEPEACIGRSADACMATPDGSTTVGAGFCLSKEAEFWDARLNAAYAALMQAEQDYDAEMAELDIAAPSTSDALREMQRAWIAWRDAACTYERSQWGGGTGGGPATAACMMRLTGEQALALEQRLNETGGQ
jgi:uncharacterized protein YecT (DUF1311 family)